MVPIKEDIRPVSLSTQPENPGLEHLQKDFLQIKTMKMPFGKYKGVCLVDLPEPYLVWFSQKGFPEGKLGRLLRAVYEIKRNGLEYLFKQP